MLTYDSEKKSARAFVIISTWMHRTEQKGRREITCKNKRK
jgi:hypothetical protein